MSKNQGDKDSSQTADESLVMRSRQYSQEIRRELGRELQIILVDSRLKQREIAVLLNVRQPEVSHLLNGHFSRFTIDKMLQFFYQLGKRVKIEVYAHTKE